MATEFVTDVSNEGKCFKVIFTTDNKDQYSYVLKAIRECVDGTLLNREIERLKRENAQIALQAALDQAISEFPVSPLRF